MACSERKRYSADCGVREVTGREDQSVRSERRQGLDREAEGGYLDGALTRRRPRGAFTVSAAVAVLCGVVGLTVVSPPGGNTDRQVQLSSSSQAQEGQERGATEIGRPPSDPGRPPEGAPGLDVALTKVNRPPHGAFLEYRVTSFPQGATRVSLLVNGSAVAEDSAIPGAVFGMNVSEFPDSIDIEVIATDDRRQPLATSGRRAFRVR